MAKPFALRPLREIRHQRVRESVRFQFQRVKFAFQNVKLDFQSVRFQFQSLKFEFQSVRFEFQSVKFEFRSVKFEFSSVRFDFQSIKFAFESVHIIPHASSHSVSGSCERILQSRAWPGTPRLSSRRTALPSSVWPSDFPSAGKVHQLPAVPAFGAKKFHCEPSLPTQTPQR